MRAGTLAAVKGSKWPAISQIARHKVTAAARLWPRICYYSRRCRGIGIPTPRSAIRGNRAPSCWSFVFRAAQHIPPPPSMLLSRVPRLSAGFELAGSDLAHLRRRGAREHGAELENADDVDRTCPSNYSAAPSGDLCSTLERSFRSDGWENRTSVRTSALRRSVPLHGAKLSDAAALGNTTNVRERAEPEASGFVESFAAALTHAGFVARNGLAVHGPNGGFRRNIFCT